MNGFDDFLRSLGLKPGRIARDGKWRRCPTESHPRSKNGAYKLAPDGRIGWGQDWSTMQEPATWRPGESADVPDFDPEAFKRRQREADRKRRRATRAARAFYNDAEPLIGGHPYLEGHGLDMTGCRGLRVDGKGWLVIPAYRDGKIMSVQRIGPDGTKRFWKGAPVSGASYTVDRRDATLTVLCEGLATGLACYAALPLCRVVVAFNAGNLSKVDVTPGMVVIAADNDHGTEERIGENPGIEAAKEAAEEIGCGIAYPTGIEGTDWADYRQERRAYWMERTLEYETRGHVHRKVDAEIRREIMKAAQFVARTEVA